MTNFGEIIDAKLEPVYDRLVRIDHELHGLGEDVKGLGQDMGIVKQDILVIRQHLAEMDSRIGSMDSRIGSLQDGQEGILGLLAAIVERLDRLEGPAST